MYSKEIIIIIARVACALIDMQSMITENKSRELDGLALAYTRDDFLNLIDEYGLAYKDIREEFSL